MQTSHSLATTLGRYHDAVYAAIDSVLEQHHHPADFYGMIRYHLGLVNAHFETEVWGQGKGLRGALLLLMTEAFGGDPLDAAPLGAGIELLHNFSLVHDDFEDGSLTRRHRPTVWSLWGAPIGINVGDGLYALAHLALFDSELCTSAPDRFIAILRRFEETSLRICEGQHSDISFETIAVVPVATYLQMISGKAAILIGTAAAIGAAAGGALAAQIELAYRFGYKLGMVFQMQDDILGIWGDEAATGKSATSDLASRKKTLPILLAMEEGRQEDRDRLHVLYGEPGNASPETIAETLEILARSNARRLSEEYMQTHWREALEALSLLSLSPEVTRSLEEFARLCIDRAA